MIKTIHLKKYQLVLDRLRKARLDSGLKQTEVSFKLDKPQSYVSKIERGERRLDIVELAELAKMYNKKINFFIK